jgi:hypothetical protein
MKLKALLLVALGAAGVGASMAVADNGTGNDQGKGHGCRGQHISGTVGPQTFTITVTKAEHNGSIAPGSTVVVTIGGTGQTVRATVGRCSSANGTTSTSTSTLTVRSVDLKAFNTSTTTTTGKDDDEHHNRGTTTTATTTTTHS